MRHKNIPAVYLIITKTDWKMLFLRRSNTGFCDGKLSLVAWHVEKWESAINALIREAKEEVGISIDKTDIKFSHVQHRYNKQVDEERIDFYFSMTCDNTETIKNCEPNKCSELVWSKFNELSPDEIVPSVYYAIKQIQTWWDYGEFGWTE